MDTQQALELAEAHRRVGRLKEAAQLYMEVLRGEPDHSESLYQLGRIAGAHGQHQAALGFLSRAIKRQPNHPNATHLLAGTLEALGEAEHASHWYRAQLEICPADESAALALERLLVGRRDIDGLLAASRELIARNQSALAGRLARAAYGLDQRRGEAALLLAVITARQDSPANSLRLLRRGLVHAPADGMALALHGQALAGLGLRAAAVVQARRAGFTVTGDPAIMLETGRTLLEQGEAHLALRCFRRALEAKAGDPVLRLELAQALLALQETGEAIRLGRALLADDPENLEASRLVGAAFVVQGASVGALGLVRADLRAGRLEQALAAAIAVCQHDPERAEARFLAGTAALELCRPAVALAQLRPGLSLLPSDSVGLATLGRTFAHLRRCEAALSWLRRAAASGGFDYRLGLDLVESALDGGHEAEARRSLEGLRPDPDASPDALLRQAAALFRLGRREEGMSLAWRLLEHRPEHQATTQWLTRRLAEAESREMLLKLALLHQESGRVLPAAIALRGFLAVAPDDPHGLYLLGRALIESETQSAGSLLARLAHLQSTNAGLLLSAGERLADLKRYDTAVELMRRAIESDFTDARNHRYAFFFNFLNQCDWPGRTRYIERFTQLAEAQFAADDPSFQVNPSIFVFLGADERLLLRSARHFARHSFPARPPKYLAHANRGSRPLRVGYLSLYLSNHHIGYSQAEILNAFDPKEIEVFAYSPRRDGDPIQAAIKERVTAFHDIDQPDPDRVARAIAADGVDVLVDLDGYVNGIDGLFTMAVLSHRPAPVQMLFHNYVGPSGADFVDYVVGDSVLFPPGTDAAYSEKLIRLPPCYYPAPPMPIAEEQSDRNDWDLPATGVVFANFGHFYKIEPHCFALWMRILKRVPGSVMWFNHWEQPTAVKNLHREAAALGVAPDRLVFGTRVEKHQHLARLRHADLFLDTLVYSSGVTSIDALWAGLPVLTVAGDSFARRVSASLNAGIGMQALACANAAEFEETAVRLAHDPQELATLRRRLWDNRVSEPLFHQSVLASHLQRAFLEAWSLHQSGAKPQPIDVAALPALECTA